MNWQSLTKNIDIKHKQNYGKELRVGVFLIDGFESGTKNLWEYLGCWAHGHNCEYGIKSLTEQERTKRLKKHDVKMKFLYKQGYKVELIWECQYQKEKKDNKDLQAFVQGRRLPFHKIFPREVTTEHILENVLDETLFGFFGSFIRSPKYV